MLEAEHVNTPVGSRLVDAPGLVSQPAQPARIRLAKELSLPLTREEVVVDHRWLPVLSCRLMVGADAGLLVALKLDGGDNGRDQQSAGDEKDLNHRATPFV